MKTLRSTVSVPLHEVQITAIERIDSEDFSGVCRKVREEMSARGQQCPQTFLDNGVLALKQYYAVALLDPMNEHAVTDAIDPFWHAHILHTKQYAKFCEDVYGQYIHHQPLDHTIESDVDHVAKMYDHTQRVYRQMFSDVNPYFYPATVSKGDLVCQHYEVSNKLLRSISTFPAITHEFARGF